MSELENKELTLEAMEGVAGGYKKPDEKPGFIIYKIRKGDNLYRIAKANNCSVNDLLRWNPKISDKNVIYYDDYLYIKK